MRRMVVLILLAVSACAGLEVAQTDQQVGTKSLQSLVTFDLPTIQVPANIASLTPEQYASIIEAYSKVYQALGSLEVNATLTQSTSGTMSLDNEIRSAIRLMLAKELRPGTETEVPGEAEVLDE